MNVDIGLLCLTANSLFTIFSGAVILYLISKRKLERHIFYYGWSIGFFLYGIEILLRGYSIDNAYFVPMFITFLIFPLSTWALNPRRDVTILLLFFCFIFLYSTLAILHLSGMLGYDELNWAVGSILLYLPVTIIILNHRKLFGNCVDKLIVGWFSLFLINALFFEGGWIADTLAIFSKIVILNGIISYDFAIVTQRVRSGLSSRTLSVTAGYRKEGGLKLVMFGSKVGLPLMAVSKWVEERVEENIRENVETNIMVMQDVVPYRALRSAAWIEPDLVHVFIFSQNTQSRKEFTVLRYGLTELGAAITEVAEKCTENEKECEILLVDLSVLIHTFGARNAYGFLLNKMGVLRSSGTSLVAVLHPETHEESAVALFKTLADEIIHI